MKCENPKCPNELYHDRNLKRKYCSDVCRRIVGIAKSCERQKTRPTKRVIYTHCQRTGCTNSIPNSRNRGSKYCSSSCNNKVAYATARSKNPDKYKEIGRKAAAKKRQDVSYRAKKWGIANPEHIPPIPEKCENPFCTNEGPICIDHDHKTNNFRGWLCSLCNHALGKVRDNPTVLRWLADYLEQRSTPPQPQHYDTEEAA